MSTSTDKAQNMTALIAAGIGAIQSLVPFVIGLIQKARQSRELTDEQANAYRNQLVSLFAQPHWQPDPVVITTNPCTGDDCKPPACTGPDCAAP